MSVGPAVNATGGQILERKIYVLIKGAPKGQQYTSAFRNLSHFLSRGIPLDVFRVTGELSFPLQVARVRIDFNFVSIDDDLILSAKLEIRRLRATIDAETADTLLMEANEGCYAIPPIILTDLLDTEHPTVTFEFNFYRRKRPATSSTTAPAGAASRKRKRPIKEFQDSDSDTQQQNEGPIIGASLYSFVLAAREIQDSILRFKKPGLKTWVRR